MAASCPVLTTQNLSSDFYQVKTLHGVLLHHLELWLFPQSQNDHEKEAFGSSLDIKAARTGQRKTPLQEDSRAGLACGDWVHGSGDQACTSAWCSVLSADKELQRGACGYTNVLGHEAAY